MDNLIDAPDLPLLSAPRSEIVAGHSGFWNYIKNTFIPWINTFVPFLNGIDGKIDGMIDLSHWQGAFDPAKVGGYAEKDTVENGSATYFSKEDSNTADVSDSTKWKKISDLNHTHDDRYYTESEIDDKLVVATAVKNGLMSKEDKSRLDNDVAEKNGDALEKFSAKDGTVDKEVINYSQLSSAVSNLIGNDLTVLADYPVRKYNGTITLSEPITNFDFIVVKGMYSVSPNFTKFTYIPTSVISTSEVLELWGDDARYARWTYTDPLTFNFHSEASSWIRTIYGVGRK